jgi:hypothetical protein
VAVWAAPPSGDPYGFVPGGKRGPTPFGELSLVREAAFDPDAGPAPTTGVGTETTWSGLVPGDPAADGVFAQSIYLRIGPVSTCEYVPDGVVTLTFGPGLRVVGAIGKKSGLDATDATWGVAWIHYGGASRGIAGDQVRIRGDVLCSSQIDDIRVLVDHGAAWQSGAWVDVVADQDDCAADEACNADINVGGIDGNADPDGDPWHADALAVRVPLTSADGAPASEAPTVACPVDAAGAWITGTLDEPEGSRVRVFAWSPEGTLFLVGETAVAADGTWSLDLDPAWPWGFGEGWSVVAQAVNDGDREQPGPFGDPVAVGDADCDGWADGDDCWPDDPDRFPGGPDPCNGQDDDCDGTTDEDYPTLGDACDGADEDFCATGTWVCADDGGIACDEPGAGTVETCNGLDDDCDGDTDEGFPDVNRNGVADCMEPEGRGFRGGGGCVAGTGPGAGSGAGLALLLVLLPALALARRRRFAAVVACLAGLAVAGASRPVFAQQVDPDLFLPAPSTWDGIALRTTRPMEHLSHRYGLGLAWAKDLLVGEDDAGRPMRAIAHRATAVVTAAIGLWDRLDIGLILPLHLRQTADGYPAPGASSAATGLGDLVLAPKVALWVPRDGHGPGVAIAVDLTFPTGRSRLMGESNVTVTPWVLLDWRFGGPVLALDLGWKVRKDVTVRDLGIGDEFRVRLGGEVPVGWQDLPRWASRADSGGRAACRGTRRPSRSGARCAGGGRSTCRSPRAPAAASRGATARRTSGCSRRSRGRPGCRR